MSQIFDCSCRQLSAFIWLFSDLLQQHVSERAVLCVLICVLFMERVPILQRRMLLSAMKDFTLLLSKVPAGEIHIFYVLEGDRRWYFVQAIKAIAEPARFGSAGQSPKILSSNSLCWLCREDFPTGVFLHGHAISFCGAFNFDGLTSESIFFQAGIFLRYIRNSKNANEVLIDGTNNCTSINMARGILKVKVVPLSILFSSSIKSV